MPSPPADDPILVERAQQGDADAFAALFRRHRERVFAVALGFLRNQDDALDVVQEAFIKAHRSLSRFKGESSFYTWLYRITANLCVDHARRNKRHRARTFEDWMADPETSAAEAAPHCLRRVRTPDEAVADGEIRRAVAAALDELSEAHRAVIVMRELNGMSYAEMADALGCPKGTIMSRLYHARRNLQKLLAAKGIRLSAGEGAVESNGGDGASKGAVMP